MHMNVLPGYMSVYHVPGGWCESNLSPLQEQPSILNYRAISPASILFFKILFIYYYYYLGCASMSTGEVCGGQRTALLN